jgi:hypothetical protein
MVFSILSIKKVTINMSIKKYFPEIHQLEIGKRNPSYLNSLWIGIFVPVFYLPIILWRLFIKHALVGFFMFVAFLVLSCVLGLMGRITPRSITIAEFAREQFVKAKNSDGES